MFRPLEAIIRSRFGNPGEEDGFGWLTAISTSILQHIPPVVSGIENIYFTNIVDISTSILQHIPPGVFAIVNIYPIHE